MVTLPKDGKFAGEKAVITARSNEKALLSDPQ
jgi:hypothetical protein